MRKPSRVRVYLLLIPSLLIPLRSWHKGCHDPARGCSLRQPHRRFHGERLSSFGKLISSWLLNIISKSELVILSHGG